jgi:hypothetical protein
MNFLLMVVNKSRSVTGVVSAEHAIHDMRLFDADEFQHGGTTTWSPKSTLANMMQNGRRSAAEKHGVARCKRLPFCPAAFDWGPLVKGVMQLRTPS